MFSLSSFYLVRYPSGYVYGLVITEVKQGWAVFSTWMGDHPGRVHSSDL